MQAPELLITELATAVSGSSKDKRQQTLQRVTDLFVTNADRFNEDHVGVFDDVLLYLIKRVETQATTELGRRLAPVDNAPFHVIQHLARHDDIAVAAPVLAQSTQLADHDLVEIAQTKSEQHLAEIAKRVGLREEVTDVIVERGDKETVQNLVTNVTASFSEEGFAKLVARAEGDANLSEQVGMRLDIPLRMLRQLLLKATEEVQSRLIAFAPLETREEIHRIVVAISNDVVRQATAARNFAQAQELILHLKQNNDFGESTILEFAKMRKYEEVVVALSHLCSAPVELIERLMQSIRYEGLLIICKANKVAWLTVGAILTNRFSQHSVAVEELRKAKAEYTKLSVPAAQKILKFFLARGALPTKTTQGQAKAKAKTKARAKA